uniref:Spore protein YkvP/CgeB glycosyl transferase-like domain-containing protein n=1 Tax=Kuenenia stuttgartiensis TaxID=174633 RepID=Q1PVY5_KUEST|nr:hypothetical protein kustc0635 [Candidatus Kuenenia stuttgartiensis]
MNKINRILIYGESWRGGMPHSMLLAFTRLGYDTIIFDYQKYLSFHQFSINRIVNKLCYVLDQFYFKKRCTEINTKFIQQVEDFLPDLIIVMKGLHVLPESLEKIKKLGISVVNWHVDDFFNPLYTMPYSKEAFTLYDIHFSPRPHLFEEYRRLGAKNVEYLGVCVDPNAFYPVSSVSGNFQCDVSFVGSWSKNRENLLKKLHLFNVQIYGSGWHRAVVSFRGIPNIHLMNKSVHLEDFSRVIKRSKICLNILTIENRDQTNLRNFEIPACKGFQLCNRTPQLLKIFKEGEEIALYENEQELIDKIRYYLDHEEARIKVAENGFKAVINGDHTYKSRCKQLISAVESVLL